MIHYYSERGYPLVYWSEPGFKLPDPVITVENYCKWYSLYIIHPYGDGNIVEAVSFECLDEVALTYHGDVSPYRDHVPNPHIVELLPLRHPKYKGCNVCERSLEMIHGRWAREYPDG